MPKVVTNFKVFRAELFFPLSNSQAECAGGGVGGGDNYFISRHIRKIIKILNFVIHCQI